MRRLILPLTLVFSLAIAMTVLSATPPTGTIKIATPGLSVIGMVGSKMQTIVAGQEAVVPVGTFTPLVLTYQVHEVTKDGTMGPLWSIMGSAPIGKLKIQVQPDATTTFEAGPPFTVKAVVGAAVTDSTGVKTVPVDFAIEGKAGERYSIGSVSKDNKRVAAQLSRWWMKAERSWPPPVSSMVEAARARYSWRVPNGFKGKYRVQVAATLGPFEFKSEESAWYPN